VAWLTSRPGALWLLPPTAERATKLADNARDPVMAAPFKGGRAVIVWEQSQHGSSGIMAQVIAGK
jgi:hypothetical protein